MFNSIGNLFQSMSSSLPFISAGAQLLGGVGAQQRTSRSAADVLAIGDREAKQTLIAGQLESQQIATRGRAEIGMAVARSGAAGLQLRGSVLDSIANSYANLEMDRLNTIYNSQRDASLLREQARARARSVRGEGRASLTRSIGNAALTLANSGAFGSEEGI